MGTNGSLLPFYYWTPFEKSCCGLSHRHLRYTLCYLRYPLWAPPNRAAIPMPQIAQRSTLLMISAPQKAIKRSPLQSMHCGHLCCPLCYLRYPLWAPPNRAAIPMPTSNRAAIHPPNDLRTQKAIKRSSLQSYALWAPLLSSVLPPLSSVGPSQSRSDPYAYLKSRSDPPS
jgi:hypothetical protein